MNKIKICLIAGIISMLGTNAFAAECYQYYFCNTNIENEYQAEQYRDPIGDTEDYKEVWTENSTASFITLPEDTCNESQYRPAGQIVARWRRVNKYADFAGTGVIAPDNFGEDDEYIGSGQEFNIPVVDNNIVCDGDYGEGSIGYWFVAEYDDPVYEPNPEYVGIMTSKKYTDAELAKKQPRFSGLGNNKLMLYSNTTAGSVASRDIVTTLGTSTTDTTIPTRGAINTGMNTVQNKLNGTAGWVALNTGTAGRIAQKPIYSSTNNYDNALVDAATLNQAVINAVNSELTEVPGIGFQINSVANMPLLSTPRTYQSVKTADVNIASNGSSCFRPLTVWNDPTDENRNCSAETLAALGPVGNKSGRWATEFPYGVVMGKSVCVPSFGNAKYSADKYEVFSEGTLTDLGAAIADGEFEAQTGVGASAINSFANFDTNAGSDIHYCYCKIDTDTMGVPVESTWVRVRAGAMSNYYSSSASCAYYCAERCGADSIEHRTKMFNAVK